MLADIICYCKMTSFMALDVVPLFLRLKDATNTCKRMRHNGGKLEELKASNVFSMFIVC